MSRNEIQENLKFLQNLQYYEQIWQNLKLENGILYVNTPNGTKSYKLNEINLTDLDNNNFRANLPNLKIEEFAKLLDISHYNVETQVSDGQLEKEQADNSKIKRFKVLKKQREDGVVIEYPYFIDENNNIHVLFNYAGTNLLREYQLLFLKLGGNVTAKDLYEVLERKMKNVNLIPDYNLEEPIREGTKLELELVNKQDSSARVYVNQYHGIYQMKNNLYTFNADGKGLNKSTYKNEGEKFENLNYDNETSTLTEKEITNQPEDGKEVDLITEEEYYFLIQYTTPEEKPEIKLFESFLEDIMLYKDFLSDELNGIITRYIIYMNELANKSSLSPSLEAAFTRYQDIINKNQEKQLDKNNEDILVRVRKLEQKYNNSGYATLNIIIYGIVITLIIVTIILLEK